ncbi:sulfite exporter TauE/SafE family protein [Fictibacillus phosphorivorans]|uniref:sulfite exporter TauE/SafE family protein n=1 Tax=Fictibacillus phosphorivorans TaxID=1221500 RepID=UPI001293FCD4|nr:sulfite exporter TauE/SafE family protein [Fictibacillus phosphorivorans]MQR94926.1 sulfite exporter TauE/SafE family protein [Fictibacillus phosphorivorans]
MEFFYILLGLCIGIFSGIFGIGGGFILTPVLILFGIPPLSAIGTSLMYSIGTSISGVAAHLRFKNILWKPAAVLGIVGIGATQVAHPLVVWLEKMGYDETIIPIFYIVLLAYFALSLLYKQSKRKKTAQSTTEIQFSYPKAVFIGFTGGFISTTLGVGGGFVMVPMLISLMKFPSRKAVGTSLVSVFFIVSAGFLTYASSVQIDYKLGLLLILGALVGTQLGAKLTTIYSSEQIQKYLGALYITILSSVILKLVHLDKAGLGIITLYVLTMLVFFLKETISHTRRKTSTS